MPLTRCRFLRMRKLRSRRTQADYDRALAALVRDALDEHGAGDAFERQLRDKLDAIARSNTFQP